MGNGHRRIHRRVGTLLRRLAKNRAFSLSLSLLRLVQTPVSPLRSNQCIVGALFDNLAFVHHHQTVGFAQG